MKFPLGLALAASLLLLGSAHAQTVTYVKPAASGTADGSSWVNATADLYTALVDARLAASAGSPQEVWVAQGTYTTVSGSTRTPNRDLSFEIGAYVQLLGGFDGTETSKLAASPSTNVTTLSGDADGDGQLAGNTYNVVFCDDCGSNAGLSGFTVTEGYANKPAGFDARGRAGAGLYLFGENGRQANLIITDVRFVDNEAEGKGGAAYFKGSTSGQSSPVLERCSFESNRAGLEGGAVFVDASVGGTANPKLTEVDFVGNTTVNPQADGAGGAVFVTAPAGGISALELRRCRFAGNSTVVGLNAGATGANGGAIYVTTIDNVGGNGTSTLLVENCIFDGNTAYSGGALYLNGVTSADLRNVTVNDNVAAGGGGSGAGVYLNSSAASVVNHISYGNTVLADPSRGGDFRFVNGTLDLSYAIVQAADAAALFSRASVGNADVYVEGSAVQYGVDPQLDSSSGVPKLGSATSPAVNAGDNVSAPASGLDYLGNARIVSGVVDLGALESKFLPLPVDLISLTAEPGESLVRVSWVSATEIDLSGYRVLRSTDGRTFEPIAFVPAMELGAYQYSDRAVADESTYYYRLESVDLDGTFYESEIVSAQLRAGTLDTLLTRLYPNPTSGELTVEIDAADGGRTVYVSVLDVQGRKLRMWPLTRDGAHVLQLDDLPGGQYVVRLDAGSRSQSQQFTIRK